MRKDWEILNDGTKVEILMLEVLLDIRQLLLDQQDKKKKAK